MTLLEFQSRVRATRRVLIPVGLLMLIVLLAAPLGISSGAFTSVLCSWLGLAQRSAEVASFVLFIFLWTFLPAGYLLLILYINWRTGLFCPGCGPRTAHINFVSYVPRHGICPKCKCQIIDPTDRTFS
jgi:hypothetical protein